MGCVAIDSNGLQSELSSALNIINGNIPKIEENKRWNLIDKSIPIWDPDLQLPWAIYIDAIGAGIASDDSLTINSLKKISEDINKIRTNIGNKLVECPSKQSERLKCFNDFLIERELRDIEEYADFIKDLSDHQVWKRNMGHTPWNPILVQVPHSFIAKLGELYGKFKAQNDKIRIVLANFEKKGNNCEGSPSDEESDCDRMIEAINNLANALNGEQSGLNTRLKRLEEAVGVNDFPVKVPVSFWGEKEPELMEKQNIPQLITWFASIFDETIGTFPICYEIEGEDSEGNKKTEDFKIPNLSEFLGEMFAIIRETNMVSDINLDTNIRTILEVGSIKKAVAETIYCSRAMCDYLGFQTQERKIKIPYMHTPQGDSLDELLENSCQEVVIEEFKNSKKSPNYQQVIAHMLTGVSILRSLGENFNSDSATNDIKTMLRNLQKAQDEDWSQLQRDVEFGYGSYSGLSEDFVQKPYGQERDRRPNLKKIKKPINTPKNQEGQG